MGFFFILIVQTTIGLALIGVAWWLVLNAKGEARFWKARWEESVDETWDDSDHLDSAWGLIANAYGGDWEKATPEWLLAAERWRDRVVHGKKEGADSPMKGSNA